MFLEVSCLVLKKRPQRDWQTETLTDIRHARGCVSVRGVVGVSEFEREREKDRLQIGS